VHDIPLAVCSTARRAHGWHRAKGFYIKCQNDPPFSRMSDFSNMRLLETSAVDTDRSKIEERIRNYGGKLEKLQKALNAARPH
jgi:hypothetical protein